MFRWLFVLFTAVPIVEIYLLFKIKGFLGVWPTIGLIVCTGLLGAWLSRQQGRRAISQWRSSMGQGSLPAEGVLSGLLILVGSVLLVTPGVVTDVLGFSLLVPPSRQWIAARMRARLQQKIKEGTVRVVTNATGADFEGMMNPHGAPRGPSQPRQVEGRVVDIERGDVDGVS